MIRTIIGRIRPKIIAKIKTPKGILAVGTMMVMSGYESVGYYKRVKRRKLMKKMEIERIKLIEDRKKQDEEEAKNIKTEEDAKKYAERHKYSVEYMIKIPEEWRNEGLYKKMIEETGDLRRVPEEKKTKEICEMAFKKDEGNYRYIPEKYKTSWMSVKAVEKDRRLIYEVPEQMREWVKERVGWGIEKCGGCRSYGRREEREPKRYPTMMVNIMAE